MPTVPPSQAISLDWAQATMCRSASFLLRIQVRPSPTYVLSANSFPTARSVIPTLAPPWYAAERNSSHL